jgi:hypothetical protein
VRLLFTVRGGLGHLHPMLPTAIAARSRGHTVAFAGGESLRAPIARSGFPYFPVGLDLATEAAVEQLVPELAGLVGKQRAATYWREIFAMPFRYRRHSDSPGRRTSSQASSTPTCSSSCSSSGNRSGTSRAPDLAVFADVGAAPELCSWCPHPPDRGAGRRHARVSADATSPGRCETFGETRRAGAARRMIGAASVWVVLPAAVK